MAIFHLTSNNITHKGGRTAIAAAAYRAGDILKDDLLNQTSNYAAKSWQVVHSEINLPRHAPKKYADRATLWNAVELVENRANARVAKEVEIAIPIEWSHEQSIEILRDYIKRNFVDQGMCADWSIHDKHDGNPHCHILLTTREINQDGTWSTKQQTVYKLDDDGNKIPVIDPETGQQKIGARGRKMWQRETIARTPWDADGVIDSWRKDWADTANKYLDPEDHITHESYKRQGIDKEPTKHEGWYARKLDEQGIKVDVIEHNKGVIERNLERLIAAKERAIEQAKQALANIQQAIDAKFAEIAQIKAIERRLEKSGYNYHPKTKTRVYESKNDDIEHEKEQDYGPTL